MTKTATQAVVEVQYDKLVKSAVNEEGATNDEILLAQQIQQAYGPAGLGILTVSGAPGFAELRQSLLPLAQAFAALPDKIKDLYIDPASTYNFGWSHGIERLANGQPDRYKGSFYANPLVDVPTTDDALIKQFPAYCRPNIWPTQHLPQYQPAFQALGRLICEVGMLVTKACDKYVQAQNPGFPPGLLLQSIQQSSCNKGRLLHYFPPEPSSCTVSAEASTSLSHDDMPSTSSTSSDKENGSSKHNRQEEGDWCGWHTDHGSLTGLTSALYMKGDDIVPSPDPQAGLYIRARQGGEVTQVCIPSDHIAFQMGEAMQVMSGGLLRATPHCVRAPRRDMSGGVSRNTLAVFMQPRWDHILETPEGCSLDSQVGVGQWQPGISFGDFAERTVQRYYPATA
ncbi:hypothetical protein ABBQ32_009935 [Trebouxia sp. C0010 RCD-2024]